MEISPQTKYPDSQHHAATAPSVIPVVSTVQIPDPTTVLTLHDNALRRVRDSFRSTSAKFSAPILPPSPPPPFNRRCSTSRHDMQDHRSATMATNLPPVARPHAAFPLSDGSVPLLVRWRRIEKSILRPGRHGAYPITAPAPGSIYGVTARGRVVDCPNAVRTGTQAIQLVKQGQLLWDPSTRRAIFTLQQLEKIEKQPHMSRYLDDFDQRIATVGYWAPELRMFCAPSQQDLDSLGSLVLF